MYLAPASPIDISAPLGKSPCVHMCVIAQYGPHSFFSYLSVRIIIGEVLPRWRKIIWKWLHQAMDTSIDGSGLCNPCGYTRCKLRLNQLSLVSGSGGRRLRGGTWGHCLVKRLQ
jgi:hypothetical protein